MDNNVADVQKLFQGDGTVDGVFDDLDSALKNIDSTAGLIKTTRTNLDKSIKVLRDQILAQQLRLELRRQELQNCPSLWGAKRVGDSVTAVVLVSLKSCGWANTCMT